MFNILFVVVFNWRSIHQSVHYSQNALKIIVKSLTIDSSKHK